MARSVKERLLPLLSGDDYISGENAAEILGVSRSAVWKAVESLRHDGYGIEAITNRGYRIRPDSDVLTAQEIEKNLAGLHGKLKIEVRNTVTSTNAVLKEIASKGADEGTVLAASEQTAGRGRFARKFYSPSDSGVYMSILLRPSFSCEKAVQITTAAAVAVAEAAEELTGRKTGIKWVNDVLMEKRKISGILTEAAINVESGTLDYAILGIGLNAYVPDGGFPDEISGIAGAIFSKRKSGQRARLAALVLEKFFGYYEKIGSHDCLDAYRKRCIVPGREITVISADGSKPATALEIDENYRLRVAYPDKSQEFLSSGEISIKLL